MPLSAAELLTQADSAGQANQADEARRLLRQARLAASREGSLQLLSAVMRREASLLDPGERGPILAEAARLARRAGDSVGEVEALEDLSREFASTNRAGVAVALLGRCTEIQRTRRDKAGMVRAILLAGRVLVEAWGKDREVPAGMVMLLWSEDAARVVDEGLARMIRGYLEGFQYTLSPAEFAEVEPFLELDRMAVIDATFARYMAEHQAELP
jgi:hypothetical protein